MLPELILEELTRCTALSSYLMAWPSLATESRLQIIQRVQRNGDTPNWLTDMALSDAEPVVRYWASRYASFNEAEPTQHPKLGNFEGASSDDKVRTARARSDDQPLVRFTVDRLYFRKLDILSTVSQTDRLVKLRNSKFASLGQFVNWLEKATDAGLTDDDLQECVTEFFALPAVARGFREDEFDQ